MSINSDRKIFLVGIGGIGISALARILRGQEKQVSGSDTATSEITEDLGGEGIRVTLGHKPENLPDETDLLLYSNAVPEDNPERQKAKVLGIRELSYPEAVGELLQDYEKVIAVAGTNGKTTTTAMIGWILEQAGLDPTVLVGSKVLAWNSNARVGGRKYFVLEADEYRRAFLNYRADAAVITNIAADHLDYYKDLADVQNAFEEFARTIKAGGVVLKGPWSGDFKLLLPGRFNQENAAAAGATCKALGVTDGQIASALESFTGTWRRFERVGRAGECEIISDYAHHPDGIRATFEAAAEEYPDKKILTVFQPHQHNRTKMLFREFVEAFGQSPFDDFIIAEIFDVAGREETEDQDISSRDLVGEIKKCGKNAEYAANLQEAERMSRERFSNYDMIIFMGAGDIYKVADAIARPSRT